MKQVKKTKGMNPMADTQGMVVEKPWWRRRWVVLACWLPLLVMAIGTGGLVWWTQNEVRLWEETKTAWEAKGVSLELRHYYPPEGVVGDAVMDDDWFVRTAGSGMYDGARAAGDPDLDNELYGAVTGPPGDTPSWFVLDWRWGDPKKGLVLGVPFDPEGEDRTNEEAAFVILNSIAKQAEENERMNRLMDLPMFVRGGSKLDKANFAWRYLNLNVLVEYYGRVAMLHATRGSGSDALDALKRCRKALSWGEDPKCMLDWLLLKTPIAIARYRLKNGGDPEMLTDLVPEFLSAVPDDPFDHVTLKLTRDEEGRLMVYSSGVDELDDGGSAEDDLRWYMDKIGVGQGESDE